MKGSDWRKHKEKWKRYGQYYLVSNRGHIYSLKSQKEINGYLLPSGYRRLDFTNSGKREVHFVHRIVGELFIPNPNNLPEINHIDGNPLNNSAENLEWVTHKQNMLHALNTGLRENCNVFSSEEIEEIRTLYKETDMSIPDLARKFDSCESTIYRHVSDLTSEFNKVKLSNFKRKEFSKEEIEQIRKDYETGLYSMQKLANKYGTNRTRIKNMVKDVGPIDKKYYKLSDSERKEMYELYKNGVHTKPELAKKYGISYELTKYYISRFEEEHE